MEIFYSTITTNPVGILHGYFRTNLSPEELKNEVEDRDSQNKQGEIIFEKDSKLLGILKVSEVFGLVVWSLENNFLVLQLKLPEQFLIDGKTVGDDIDLTLEFKYHFACGEFTATINNYSEVRGRL